MSFLEVQGVLTFFDAMLVEISDLTNAISSSAKDKLFL